MRGRFSGFIPLVCGLTMVGVLMLALLSVAGRSQAAGLQGPAQVEPRASQAAVATGASERPLIMGLSSEPSLDFN